MHDKPRSFENVQFQGPKVLWLRPSSLIELSTCLQKHPEAKIVSGCTSEDNHPQKVYFDKVVFVQINWLKELHSFEVYENHVCIGGGLTVAEVKQHLLEAVKTLPGLI